MNNAINTYCYLLETSEEGLDVFSIESTGESQSLEQLSSLNDSER